MRSHAPFAEAYPADQQRSEAVDPQTGTPVDLIASAAVDPQVSVILPLFGSHRGTETLAAVCAAWLEQDVPCEVIVATGGEIELDLPYRNLEGSRLRVVRGSPSWTSPGLLRNIGARSARSELLYASDADVLPLGRDYMRRALGLLGDAGSRVIAQPWMLRLVSAPGRPGIRVWHPPARKHACYVTVDEGGVLTSVPGELFEWQGSYLVVTAPDVVCPPCTPSQRRMHGTCHWGGLLVAKKVFEDVGGYSTAYLNWGCQDDDLLVKLASRREVVQAWRVARSLACLHFEHPRPYGGPALEANRARLERRIALGAEAMIRADLHAIADSGIAGPKG